MLQYLLKLSISLSIVYLFYQLFLRRLTFYNWNRWYLLIYSMVCFIIPFVNVFTIIVSRPALRESVFINYIPAITQMTPADQAAVAATHSKGIDWLQVGVLVMAAGVLVMIVRLLIQYYSLYKMRSKAVLLYEDKVKLYHIDAPVMPFSFGRGIYVNQHQHSETELKEIIRHEFIHVKQRHSLDIMWAELLCILNWYNPFAWLLRHDIRQNLEFIADQQVLQTGLDRKQYQYLLLKVIGVNSFSIATNFNFSSLKRRIAMMNKAKSARVHLIRFLFLLPLLVVILLAFRNSTQGRHNLLRGPITDTIPNADKEPPGWKDILTIDVNDGGKVTVRLKNQKVEKYDLNKPKDRAIFEQKYGPLPEPPAPPAAPGIGKGMPEIPEAPELAEAPERPEAPEAPEKVEAPEPPEAPERPEIAEIAEVPVPPLPPLAPMQVDCFNKKGFCITVADNNGECIVIVKDKSNKIVQAVALSDWNNDKQQYENKYGEIPLRQVIVAPIKVTGVRIKPSVSVQPKPETSVQPKPAVSVQPKPVTSVQLEKVEVTTEAQPTTQVVALTTVKDVKVAAMPAVKPALAIRKVSLVPATSVKLTTVTKVPLQLKFREGKPLPDTKVPLTIKKETEKPAPATKEP